MLKTAKNLFKKILGVLLVIIGIIALITPLTPGAWLGLVGLELLGLRILFQNKVKRVLKICNEKYNTLFRK